MHYRLLHLALIGILLVVFSGARAQDKGYDVTSYHVSLSLDRQHNALQGVVTMDAVATTDLTSILQHLKDLTIDQITVSSPGSVTAVMDIKDTTHGTYTIQGFNTIVAGTHFTVTTTYHGNPTNEGGSNPWGGVTTTSSMMFAMGVGFSAPYISCTRHWMPCYDLPDDKADSATLVFNCPDSEIVVSNGMMISNTVDNSTHVRTMVWKESHPIASYLLTFATGNFFELSMPNDLNIPIVGYCNKIDSLAFTGTLHRESSRALKYFDSLFAPYPFEKVGYVVAPIGSMEHQTMITLVRQAALDSNGTTAVHELAHMWWGDWVTCKDFNDPWLNEGFATFCEGLYRERFISKASYYSFLKSSVNGAVANGSTIPMYGAPYYTSPRDNYPYPVIYQKGSAVLGMLRYVLGDEAFFKAMRDYGTAHRYANATSADLQKDFETSSGKDLKWFFDEWVYGTWYPEISVTWQPVANGYTVTFAQMQDPSKHRYFRMLIPVDAFKKSGSGAHEITSVLMDSIGVTTVFVPSSFVPDTLRIDPDGIILKKTIGKVTMSVNPNENTALAALSQMYLLSFSPNPASRSNLQLCISTLPFVMNTDLPGSTYILQRLALLTSNHGVLQLFDPNGKQVYSELLEKLPTIGGTSYEDFKNPKARYELNIPSLSSGTYFAKVVFGNSVVGSGTLVVTQ